jgi:hypothetical protein
MASGVEPQILSLKREYGDPIPKSWSVNFEEDPYRDRPDLIIAESLEAIAATHPVDDRHATFVNLVTPGELGDPIRYLVPALKEVLGDTIETEEEGQCGCGGYVLRVWRQS